MLGPFLYDTRRTLTSKSVLIAMAAMVLLSLAAFGSFSANAIPPNNNNTSQIFVYYNSSGYHFIALAWTEFGQPAAGVKFDLNVTIPAVPPRTVSGSAVTNSSGSTQFTIAVPESNSYSVGVVVTASGSSVIVSGDYAPFSSSTPPGQTVSVFHTTRYQSPATPATVTGLTNTSSRDILVSWAGFNGSSPSGYLVYYRFLSGTPCQNGAFVQDCGGVQAETLIPAELNQSNAQLLGTMRSYVQVLPSPQLTGNLSEAPATIAASGDIVAIGLAYPNGTSVATSTSNLPLGQVYPDSALTRALNNQVAVSFFETFFGLFIPLLTIVTVYSVYGKDRVSGVLESVLAQPVTRRGLSLSRYVSSFAGISVATLASVAALDLIAQHFSGLFIDASILISSTAGLLVELAAFIGTMMLLSHLVRSSGSLIGIGVGLFLVIDFFQGVIATLVTSVLGIQSGSVGFYQLSVSLEFVNPAAFVSLVGTYLTGTISSVGLPVLAGQSFSIVPQAYGITIPTIVAAAVLWILVPLACFLYMAIRRD